MHDGHDGPTLLHHAVDVEVDGHHLTGELLNFDVTVYLIARGADATTGGCAVESCPFPWRCERSPSRGTGGGGCGVGCLRRGVSFAAPHRWRLRVEALAAMRALVNATHAPRR